MNSKDTGRLQYEKRCHYISKVLIGTWFEDLQRYVHNKHNHVSSYSVDYVPKQSSFVHPNIVWENKIRAEGFGPRIIIDHERDKYHNNFSTTYDLTYRHLPQISSGIKKRYSTRFHNTVPQQDFALNYGNVTKFGKRDDKKSKWTLEIMDPPPRMTTETKDAYREHEKTAYSIHRFAPNSKTSSKLVRVNQDFANLPLRDIRVSIPPDSLVRQQRTYTCPMYIKSLE